MPKKPLAKTGRIRRRIEKAAVFLLAGGVIWLLAGARPARKIRSTQLLKTRYSWDGTLLPTYPAAQPEVSMWRITVPPGVGLAKHKHPVINAGILTKGELTVRTDSGKTVRLKAGDSIAEVVNTWHYGKNEGKTTAEILVWYAGAEGVPITVYQAMK
jgi:quercetin dioxygenase-like cupin family protein